ncbi:MAG TPA: hypothetical protein VGY55_05140 [Pirellulales bacterium]|jgi:hypothetical protein|nr:hypothetical protein [Pirellulales bacterium]
MNGDAESQLLYIASKLVGNECWNVSAGGATGSRFILDFGAKLKWVIDPRNVLLNARLQDSYHGEFGLQVGCAAWRLDSEEKPLTAWTDLAVPGGPMVAGLELLRGCVVVSAEITRPALDLVLAFDKRYFLRVFCDQFDERFDNYSLSFRGTYVSVEARSRAVVSGTGEAVGDQ